MAQETARASLLSTQRTSQLSVDEEKAKHGGGESYPRRRKTPLVLREPDCAVWQGGGCASKIILYTVAAGRALQNPAR